MAPLSARSPAWSVGAPGKARRAAGDNPVLGQFLGFLARDIANHSERLQAVDFGLVQRLRSLSSGLPALTVSGQDALTTHPASPSGRNLDRGQQAKAEALRLQMHADPAGAGPHHRLGYRRCRDDRLDPHGAAGGERSGILGTGAWRNDRRCARHPRKSVGWAPN